jgi:hypothetical protein
MLPRKNTDMRFVYLIFFILAANLSNGSVIKKTDHKAVKAVLKIDTSGNVSVRHFDKAALERYSRQQEFRYIGAKEQLSWWDRFWDWFWNWFWSLFDSKGLGVIGIIWNIIELILLLGGVAALIYFILKSAGIDPRNIFSRKSAPSDVPYSEFFEDINTIDFDAEIENAVAKHNYRFAVRLLYLRCLKQLSDSGLIDWKIDKTNSTYINELNDDNRRESFSLLTRQFEYVWYGEFLIDGTVYNTIALLFRDFNKQKA